MSFPISCSAQESEELNSDQTGSLNARTNDSRSSASDAKTSHSEFSDVSQGHATSQICGRSNPTEPSTENVAFEEGSITTNEEPERTAGRRRNDLEQPGAYQLVDGRRHTSESWEMSTPIHGNELAGTIAVDGQFGDGSCPVQEEDPIAGTTASAHARQSFQMDNDDASSGHSICNGGDGNALLQEDQVEQDDRMERPEHQPFLQQEGGTQVNGLCVPIQETELCRSRESGTCQTRDQGCASSHYLQETEQPAARQPGEPSALLYSQQPRDDGSVNVVSSLGQIEQPIEHACERQEIGTWIGQIDRQVLHQLDHYHQRPLS
ncbi:uncharacterized protein LOC111340778 [Stylophora pistillata]|uniref:uncharacterized protein LOC111340778 n=1 Tax=Stylophora pistillata TaxID=50429 RepID=UPI000C0415E1|nr:uncharacterized protein LOC111340778 [Stylophora pistillata]